MKRIPGHVAVLLFALSLIGSVIAVRALTEETSDEEEIKQTVQTFYRSIFKNDVERACLQLSRRARREIERRNRAPCGKVFTIFGGEVPEGEAETLRDELIPDGVAHRALESIAKGDVEIDGDRARLRFAGPGDPDAWSLIRENDRWRIAHFELLVIR